MLIILTIMNIIIMLRKIILIRRRRRKGITTTTTIIFNFTLQIKFIIFYNSNNIFSNLLIIILNISNSSLSGSSYHARPTLVGSGKLARLTILFNSVLLLLIFYFFSYFFLKNYSF
jgi:hypothetical protein